MEMSIIIAFHYIDEVSFDEATGTVLVSFLDGWYVLVSFSGCRTADGCGLAHSCFQQHTHTHAHLCAVLYRTVAHVGSVDTHARTIALSSSGALGYLPGTCTILTDIERIYLLG